MNREIVPILGRQAVDNGERLGYANSISECLFIRSRAQRIRFMQIPHPFPYQGSKRTIARHILPFIPGDVSRLVEPFCGSAAISIVVAARSASARFWLNDIDSALMSLWSWILNRPDALASGYERLWNEQHPRRKDFFFEIRDEFNRSRQPHHHLYLLARIVKGSVRYSSRGEFNQSPDNRRAGMKPETMRERIIGVSRLLQQRTELSSLDFRDILASVNEDDLVYLDPPYQGASFARDRRYRAGVAYDDLADALSRLNDMRVSYILSYDGKTGGKEHGKPLPTSLALARRDIHAGRSSQATLLGRDARTVESLYLSPALRRRLQDAVDEPRRARVLPVERAYRGRFADKFTYDIAALARGARSP